MHRYLRPRRIGDRWCALLRLNFTIGLAVGIDSIGHSVRYCFEHAADAAEPDRAVSVTLLPDVGRKVKIEIGDTVVDLTVREARMLGELTAGLMLRFGAKY